MADNMQLEVEKMRKTLSHKGKGDKTKIFDNT